MRGGHRGYWRSSYIGKCAQRSLTSPRTRAILINSPSNPTGVVMEPERMKELAKLDIPIISDEIYHGLVYEGKERSILEFTNNAFVLNGFSKLYAMTGWRLGYLIAPPQYIRAIQKMAQNFFISASAAAPSGSGNSIGSTGDERTSSTDSSTLPARRTSSPSSMP